MPDIRAGGLHPQTVSGNYAGKWELRGEVGLHGEWKEAEVERGEQAAHNTAPLT
jgi:hypothetical protein